VETATAYNSLVSLHTIKILIISELFVSEWLCPFHFALFLATSKQLSVFQLLRSYIEQNAEVSSLFHLEKNDQISNEALMEIAGIVDPDYDCKLFFRNIVFFLNDF